MRLQKKLLGAGVAAALAVGALIAPPAHASATVLVWADDDGKVTGLTKLAEKFTGATVTVVKKTGLKDALTALTDAEGSPDIVIGAHDWVGGQSSNGQIIKLSVPAPTKALFPAATFNAFNYGGNQYGVPMSVENIAWIQNNQIMGTKCPATLDDALKTIAAYEKAKKVKLDKSKISVPGGDPYHHYPLFSGLGGYVFGTNKKGGLVKTDIGLDNATFLKNANKYMVAWQKSGLFGNYANSKAGVGGTDLFAQKKTAAIFTGPWNAPNIAAMPFKTTYCAFPSIVKGITSRPFSGVQGLMITKFAGMHGADVLAASKAFLNFAATTANQTAYAKDANVIPANSKSKAPALLNGFKAAGNVSVPMPNIPEMNAVWGQLSGGWSKSVAKTNPSSPQRAWIQAAQNVADTITP